MAPQKYMPLGNLLLRQYNGGYAMHQLASNIFTVAGTVGTGFSMLVCNSFIVFYTTVYLTLVRLDLFHKEDF